MSLLRCYCIPTVLAKQWIDTLPHVLSRSSVTHQEQVDVIKSQILQSLFQGWPNLLSFVIIIPAQLCAVQLQPQPKAIGAAAKSKTSALWFVPELRGDEQLLSFDNALFQHFLDCFTNQWLIAIVACAVNVSVACPQCSLYCSTNILTLIGAQPWNRCFAFRICSRVPAQPNSSVEAS